MSSADILLPALSLVIGVSGAIVGGRYLLKYRAIITIIETLAGAAKAYYVAKADGTFSPEDDTAIRQAIGEFFDAIEALGISIVRPE